MLLENKIAVITGASRGIGKATALKLAGEGATALLVGRKTDTLKAVEDEIKEMGGNAESYACDVCNL